MGDYVDYTDLIVTIDNDDMSYEQYGASPSPDYPSPIENVEGKNKLDYKTVSNTPNTVVSLIENGFNVSGQYAGKVVINNLKKNTNYYLQYLTQNITGAVKYVAVFAGNSQTTILKEITSGVGGAFNTGENTEINIWFYGGRGANNIGEANFTNIQLKEDTVETDYVPYNSLEIKDIGKQIFNKNDNYVYTNAPNSITINQLNTGLRIKSSYSSGIPTAMYKSIDLRSFAGKTVKMKSKIVNSAQNKGEYVLGLTSSNLSSRRIIISNNVSNKEISFIIPSVDEMGDSHFLGIWLRVNGSGTMTSNAYVDFTDLMVVIGDTIGEYEDYQEQKVDFPLSEGQKLMEGSYLASDGIHHKRKQVVLNGSESWSLSSGTNRYSFWLRNSTISNMVNAWNYKLSNYFKYENKVYSTASIPCIAENTAGANPMLIFNTDGSQGTTISQWKTWLSQNPITVEYELAEEEIVPYTEAQQEAWDKIESMKLYDGVNHIESTSEIDIKYNYIYKKPSIKNKSNIENKISSGEYQTIIDNKRYFVFLEEELKSVRNDITDRLYIDTNKNIAKVMKRVDKLVLNGTEEWNVNTTHSNVFYTAKPKNMADNETNIFCTITDEFSKDLSGETYGILIDTNINIKIPKVKTVTDLKAYLAKEPITIQYKATEEIKDIILLSKPSSYWTTCEDEFKYPQMQKTTNKRGCVADVIGEEIDVFCKTNKEQFEKIATHKNATGYAVNRIKKKKWKSIQLKFSSNKSFELFSCTLESYIGSYIKR